MYDIEPASSAAAAAAAINKKREERQNDEHARHVDFHIATGMFRATHLFMGTGPSNSSYLLTW